MTRARAGRLRAWAVIFVGAGGRGAGDLRGLALVEKAARRRSASGGRRFRRERLKKAAPKPTIEWASCQARAPGRMHNGGWPEGIQS